jgi:N-acetylneuraminic acid mutarotase
LSGVRTRIDLQVYNGKLWTFGGYDSATVSADVFEGTVSGTITWTTHANKLPSARFGTATTVLNNLMYVIGGYDYAGPSLYSQVLTSADGDNWTVKGTLPQGRLYGGVAVLPIQ